MVLLQAHFQMPEKRLAGRGVWRAIVREIKCCPMFSHLFNSHTGNLMRGGTRGLGICGEDFLSFMDFIHNAQEKGSGPQTGRTASL